MLKALDLLGFKSFADKTRFEFPPGITVVVGPNGSGKSNIVDAIKWVLGEQSAKSLRGKEMADVIYKGSAGSGRKPLNTAEATIIFDNGEGRLQIDAPEVHVTRRVYRSGEGEYLINGQACRLRDIKDLFSGTGVGTDAYSLIEQGKVDTLLQASAKDRRAIFEEAAGISRFKAKKIEATRRLERVDQNLVRLGDIVEEVAGRLRSVRSQASKARRYKEHTERLQQLRTQVGLVDWRDLTERLGKLEQELDEAGRQAAGQNAKAEQVEARALGVDTEATDIGEQIHGLENRLAQTRERIAAAESTAVHERRTIDEHLLAARQVGGQVLSLATRAGDLKTQLAAAEEEVREAQALHDHARDDVAEHEQAHASVVRQLEEVRRQTESRRQDHMELLRESARLPNEMSSVEIELASAQAAAARSDNRQTELAELRRTLDEEIDELRSRQKDFEAELAEGSEELSSVQEQLAESRRRLAGSQQELVALQGAHAQASQRADVLEGLEERREGLGRGEKQVLDLARRDEPGEFADVCGLVAELVQAGVETAPLIDVALGPRAQFVVVRGGSLLKKLAAGELTLDGRVGFVTLDRAAHGPRTAGADLTGMPGVVGPAGNYIDTDDRYRPLFEQLLEETWFVESLAQALDLKRRHPRCRFVTLAGELVDVDGAVTAGPRQEAGGLISRRSELRLLKTQIADLDRQIKVVEQVISAVEDKIGQQLQSAEELTTANKQLGEEISENRVQLRSAEERLGSLAKEQETLSAERRAAQSNEKQLLERLGQTRQEAETVDGRLAQVIEQIKQETADIERLDRQRNEHAERLTAAKVELATCSQRLGGLQATLDRYREAQSERRQAIDQAKSQLAAALDRKAAAERNVLQATGEIARLALTKENAEAEVVRLDEQRRRLLASRGELRRQGQAHRDEARKLEDRCHKLELKCEQLRHERTSLEDRLREDYGIELSTITHEPTEEEAQQREEVDAEISELRKKINAIGAVNMDALEELEDLEARYQSLAGQQQDLIAAKDSLEKIIHKINADSRRLFSETLAQIRENFQLLFRKVFGGGQADIVLEEGADILEGGIDIIANPPGKHALSISLLSGGEKALTAVTLLLAIFQFRPSPFCVLDEVDGPLDEANIGRFLDVLREFLEWTKFVVVTHSKKTMSAATTLYGVTMQESGVSKRVAVRFEDVSEDGHIAKEAIERAEESEEDRGAA